MTNSQDLWLCCDPFKPIFLGKKCKVVIGRSKDCNLVLEHKSVSRQHCFVKSNGVVVILNDLSSSNGTFVNGARVHNSIPLKLNDKVQIGPYELEIRLEPFIVRSRDLNVTDTSFHTAHKLASMTGQLEKTSLIEVLQSIEFNEKTGTLYVSDGLEEGYLVFADGRPIAANFAELADDRAVIEMLHLKKGSFMLLDRADPIEATMKKVTITNLLLEFSRIQDERSLVNTSEDVNLEF